MSKEAKINELLVEKDSFHKKWNSIFHTKGQALKVRLTKMEKIQLDEIENAMDVISQQLKKLTTE